MLQGLDTQHEVKIKGERMLNRILDKKMDMWRLGLANLSGPDRVIYPKQVGIWKMAPKCCQANTCATAYVKD